MTAFQKELFTPAPSTIVEASVLEGDFNIAASGITHFDMIDQLLGQFRQREQAIHAAKALIDDAQRQGVMSYFIDGMRLVYGNDYTPSIPTDANAAVACLRIEFWNRLLREAKVFEVMPAAKREKARLQFSGIECPPFDESTVRPTLHDLLQQRKTFFAERVDGIFQSLSKQYVTNSPAGFSKKMILAGVFNRDGYADSSMVAVISDLRGVVGRLTGRGEPQEYGTRQILDRLYKGFIGKKVPIDGGAFTAVVHKVGTVHFEVAPEVAVELNAILAHLYPMTIPSRFRTPPKKPRVGSFDLKVERLPMEVIDMLSAIEFRDSFNSLNLYSKSQSSISKAVQVLEDIGAEVSFNRDKSMAWVRFDYEPRPVIEQLIFGGVVPEQASYQFYPTKSRISKDAAQRLCVEAGKRYCEPSAGLGDLACHLPMATTTCIELAQVRAKVLEAKGYNTVKADFLEWAKRNSDQRFDGILMNPPFSKGRALAHIIAAASLLAEDGRLVAILPASMTGTQPLEGFSHDWSEAYVDQFEGTSVRVVILTASRI
ncbi:DUF4942 domain-containing protein [Pseudomonas savastanoi]|uniref:DUF4942 domain-containing protein n=1 Tax=Pseudomonas savastanoi TaxID=29438 RepID=UPI000E328D38|nr:DUF4942 domain-containing protein [Pseudomonas savastanoi]